MSNSRRPLIVMDEAGPAREMAILPKVCHRDEASLLEAKGDLANALFRAAGRWGLTAPEFRMYSGEHAVAALNELYGDKPDLAEVVKLPRMLSRLERLGDAGMLVLGSVHVVARTHRKESE